LEEKRNRADIIGVFKMAKGWSAIPLESMYELSTVKHLRGHKFKLQWLSTESDLQLEVRRNFFH